MISGLGNSQAFAIAIQSVFVLDLAYVMYAEKGRGVSPSDLKHKHFWSVDLSQWLKGLGQIIEGCHASNNSERRQSVTLEKRKKHPLPPYC